MKQGFHRLFLRRDELQAKLLPRLLGRVFHVTCLATLDSVIRDGAIRPNSNGHLRSPFGSTNGYFRKRGCVSVFDYRLASPEQIDASIGKCSPYRVVGCEDKIAVFFLAEAARAAVVPWSRWKEERAFSDKIVPFVEGGHRGPIALIDIEEILCVAIEVPHDPLVERLRSARARGAG